MIEPTSHYFHSRGLKLHFADWGNESAPPLVLVHGGRDHCRNWDWVAEKLRHKWHIVAPDLRGHGDSAWSPDGDYTWPAYLSDLAAFMDQLKLGPVALVGHSLGGTLSVNYTALYGENVSKLVSIEGLATSPRQIAEYNSVPVEQRLRRWIDMVHLLGNRQPRRYASVEAAAVRMAEENKRLTPEQARHLTVHGLRQNDDGSYSWKFDNRIRGRSAVELRPEEQHQLWGLITCPLFLIYGVESWFTNPVQDGRIVHFKNAKVSLYEGASHWVQHDKLEKFVGELEEFLGA